MKTNTRKKTPPAPRALFYIPTIFGMLAAALLVQGCLSGAVRGYTPGIYEGSGKGFRGPIHVQVQVSQAGIEDIVITSHKEEAYPGAAAIEELLESVLEQGTTDLDAISGATFSSRGFLDALEEALGKAALNL